MKWFTLKALISKGGNEYTDIELLVGFWPYFGVELLRLEIGDLNMVVSVWRVFFMVGNL